MNKIRARLLTEIFGLLYDGDQTVKKVLAASQLNQEFIDRSRGHGTSKGFIKSVAFARDNTTYFPPEKRNGRKERSRRSAQQA